MELPSILIVVGIGGSAWFGCGVWWIGWVTPKIARWLVDFDGAMVAVGSYMG